VTNRFNLPNLGVGLGLRTVHYSHILEAAPAVDWFEIVSDNYMETAGRPLYYLDAIAERYRNEIDAMYEASKNRASNQKTNEKMNDQTSDQTSRGPASPDRTVKTA